MENSKTLRQYAGVACSLLAYYIIHEGAHLLYALCTGVFKQINIMNVIGVQIDIYRDQMTDTQLGLFCLAGPVATLIAAWILIGLTPKVCASSNSMLKAVVYYVTMTMLFLDPLYLSVFYRFVGGGDMNGIALLIPEMAASIAFGILFLLHAVVFVKYVYPQYRRAFEK